MNTQREMFEKWYTKDGLCLSLETDVYGEYFDNTTQCFWETWQAAIAAQPEIPLGWKLVPVVPTEEMVNEGSCAQSLPGPHYIESRAARECWKYMIEASPELNK